MARATIDGVKRLYSFRHLPNLPLILSVAVAVDDIYAGWWQRALAIGSVLILLCGATIVLCHLFRRKMLRRLAAERALVEAASRLSVIAATDGLTGVANRRAFDERLTHEWLRAMRGAKPLSLLMIDVDFFKGFNDRYGHPEGDEVLRRIAGCIEANMRRPADFSARFGGEEFVALLPENALHGALIVAERIRAAVAELAIPHIRAPCGYVTISIGVASAYPGPDTVEALLVARADAALYKAKHAGRDQVCSADPDAAILPDWVPASSGSASGASAQPVHSAVPTSAP